MYFKHAVAALCAIFCLQNAVEGYSYLDAINAIEDARKTIDTAANIAIQITELDLVKLQQLSQSRDNLYLRYQMYFSVIDQLNNTAGQNKIDVAKCLLSYPNLTKNYQNLTTFQEKNCVNKNNTTPSVLIDAIIKLKSNTNAPYDLLQSLNKCNYDGNCINNIVAQAKSYGKSIPKDVITLITSNELLVYKTSVPLPQCQASIETGLNDAVSSAGGIVSCLTTAVFAA